MRNQIEFESSSYEPAEKKISLPVFFCLKSSKVFTKKFESFVDNINILSNENKKKNVFIILFIMKPHTRDTELRIERNRKMMPFVFKYRTPIKKIGKRKRYEIICFFFTCFAFFISNTPFNRR